MRGAAKGASGWPWLLSALLSLQVLRRLGAVRTLTKSSSQACQLDGRAQPGGRRPLIKPREALSPFPSAAHSVCYDDEHVANAYDNSYGQREVVSQVQAVPPTNVESFYLSHSHP